VRLGARADRLQPLGTFRVPVGAVSEAVIIPYDAGHGITIRNQTFPAHVPFHPMCVGGSSANCSLSSFEAS